MSSSAGSVLAGVFVGGESRRMGSPKGLLRFRGEPLIGRWLTLFERLGVPVVLVGRRPEYARFTAPALEDDPPGVGPAGGLGALLGAAVARPCTYALAVACDMPYVDDALVETLLDCAAAPLVAVRRDARWEPFFARYEAAKVLPVLRARLARERRDLQGLCAEAGAVELPLPHAERGKLDDWDSPTDIPAGPGEDVTP